MKQYGIGWLAMVVMAVMPHCASAQTPKLSNPLEGAIGLSATFAEVRSNHFHAGIDMRTGGTEGHAVHAAADGYVSAVRISSWGGGKMLYITHADGYSTVYMHLNSYVGKIGQAVRHEQERTMQYAIYKEFEPGELPVKRGEVVARSGNTGGSGGPHLHFELRHGGETMNPLLYGLDYSDGMKPTIRGIKLYPVGGEPMTVAQAASSVAVDRPFYVGVYATDAAEGSTPKNGPDRIEVYIDGNLFFRYTTESFALDSSRMVNAVIDYAHYKATRQGYVITRGLRGAEGPWVSHREGDGIARLTEGRHRLTVRVYDIAENCAERTVTLEVGKGGSVEPTREVRPADGRNRLAVAYDEPLTYKQDEVSIDMPAGTLYEDDILKIATARDDRYLSAVVEVMPEEHQLPPDKWYTLRLRQTREDEHAVVVRLDGAKMTAYRTTRKGGMYVASVRDFGRFAVVVDSVPPTASVATMKGMRWRIKIGDDLSGIDTYHCYLNGKWVLAEYDGKTAALVIDVTGRTVKGKNELIVDLTDVAGNSTRKRFEGGSINSQ